MVGHVVKHRPRHYLQKITIDGRGNARCRSRICWRFVQVGWILSKSVPCRRISLDSSSVWPSSGRPVFSIRQFVEKSSRYAQAMPPSALTDAYRDTSTVGGHPPKKDPGQGPGQLPAQALCLC
jgi:hypothetical protein